MDPRGGTILIIANKDQQQTLLEVGKLDLELAKAARSLAELEKNSEADNLRTRLLEASDRLLQAHAKLENLQSELKKLAIDLELVESRIEHDEKKALQVTSEREQKAVAGELVSLKARKSALEDAELERMDEIEQAESEVTELTQERASLNLELEKVLAKQHGESLTLSAAQNELKQKRDKAFESLSPDLQSAYARRANRGIAVAQTLGRDCSACRLSINAVEFESILAQSADHVPTCPNCDAMIIR
jgi:predicted  nucleic acid-binding Zn-ribbon protein